MKPVGEWEIEMDRRLRILAGKVPLSLGSSTTGYVYPAAPISTPMPEGTAQSLIDWERDDSSRLR